jgi:Zn-dependent protease with chaperone function
MDGIHIFCKRYKNLFIFFYLQFLIHPQVLYAEDEYVYIEHIANLLNDKRGNPSYKLQLNKSGPLAQTTVFEPDPARISLPTRVCRIRINTEFIKNFQLSNNAIAVVIGHEMGHCENEPLTNTFSRLAYAEKNWSTEYAADLYGVNLANQIGFNGLAGFNELTPIIGNRNSPSHPNMALRMKAIETGDQIIQTSIRLNQAP